MNAAEAIDASKIEPIGLVLRCVHCKANVGKFCGVPLTGTFESWCSAPKCGRATLFRFTGDGVYPIPLPTRSPS